jgi:hypothetical protein
LGADTLFPPAAARELNFFVRFGSFAAKTNERKRYFPPAAGQKAIAA